MATVVKCAYVWNKQKILWLSWPYFVAQAGLEFTMESRLALSSGSSCLRLLSHGITGTSHQIQLLLFPNIFYQLLVKYTNIENWNMEILFYLTLAYSSWEMMSLSVYKKKTGSEWWQHFSQVVGLREGPKSLSDLTSAKPIRRSGDCRLPEHQIL